MTPNTKYSKYPVFECIFLPNDINTWCIFQVQGKPAAVPRASGYTSVIPQFRQYRSQGYSTLRHTCSSMRKCSNVISKSIFPNFCFVSFLVQPVQYNSPYQVSGWVEGRKGKDLTVHSLILHQRNNLSHSKTFFQLTLALLNILDA